MFILLLFFLKIGSENLRIFKGGKINFFKEYIIVFLKIDILKIYQTYFEKIASLIMY